MSDLFPNKRSAVDQQGQDLNLIENVLTQLDEERRKSEDLGPETRRLWLRGWSTILKKKSSVKNTQRDF